MVFYFPKENSNFKVHYFAERIVIHRKLLNNIFQYKHNIIGSSYQKSQPKNNELINPHLQSSRTRIRY